MANALVRRLREALEKIEAERTRLDNQAEAFRQVIAYFEADAEQGEAPVRETPAKAITNEMWKILEEAQEPLHYVTIYKRLQMHGFNVPGKEPARNVGAHLSNDPRFENVGRGMWALKSWRGSPPGSPAPAPHPAEPTLADIPSLGPPENLFDDGPEDELPEEDIGGASPPAPRSSRRAAWSFAQYGWWELPSISRYSPISGAIAHLQHSHGGRVVLFTSHSTLPGR